MTRARCAAQSGSPRSRARSHTWFCGAWTGHGFHEDGLVSGLAVAEAPRRLASPGATAKFRLAEAAE